MSDAGMVAVGESLGVAGREVLVAGAGVTGRSVAAALVDMGSSVTVTDTDEDRLTALRPLGVRLEVSRTEPGSDTSLVVTSPGWRPTAPLLESAVRRGIEVVGDVELAWRIGRCHERAPRWLAVTGTNGKTTTVGMLEAMLRAAGFDAVACGNVGLPVLDAVRAGHDTLAVELSSFQLHYASSIAPRAAVVLNVAEDHLDWHGSLEEYAAAKGTVYRRAATAVDNLDDPWSGRLAAAYAPAEAERVGLAQGMVAPGQLGTVEGALIDHAFTDSAVELARMTDVPPPLGHNTVNALAAAALARSRGVSAEAVRDGLRGFSPDGHRSVEVAEVAGVRYVDNSKATNPHAAAGSLRSYRTVVWIAGGVLKGAAVDELVAEAAGVLRGVVLLGTDAETIEDALARHAPQVPRVRVPSGHDGPMAAAVRAARDMARTGDVVLLAPAAASIDLFRDYKARGDAFADAVRALASGAAHGTG